MAKKTTKKAAKPIKAFTPAKKAKMVALLKEGNSVYSIAKTLNLTPSVARYHADRIRGNNLKQKIRASAADKPEVMTTKERNALTITEALLELDTRIGSASEELKSMLAAKSLMESLIK